MPSSVDNANIKKLYSEGHQAYATKHERRCDAQVTPRQINCRVHNHLANLQRSSLTPHMSTAAPYSRHPKQSSGGRYHLVTTVLVMCRPGLPYDRASPKSASLSLPSLEYSRLAGFRSCAQERVREKTKTEESTSWKHSSAERVPTKRLVLQ